MHTCPTLWLSTLDAVELWLSSHVPWSCHTMLCTMYRGRCARPPGILLRCSATCVRGPSSCMLAWTLLILSRGRYATQLCASHICLLHGSVQPVCRWIAFVRHVGVILLPLSLYILTFRAACLCWPVQGLAHFIIDGSMQQHNFKAHRGCC